MRLNLAALLMVATASAASAQPAGSIIHEMTTIGKQKDMQGTLPPIEKKSDQMFTIVGGGVNVEGEAASNGGITVLDDGGPATKAAPAPKAEMAKPPAAQESSLWDDFIGNFDDGSAAKPSLKPVAAAPIAPKPVVTPEPQKLVAPAPKVEAKAPIAVEESNPWDDFMSHFEDDSPGKPAPKPAVVPVAEKPALVPAPQKLVAPAPKLVAPATTQKLVAPQPKLIPPASASAPAKAEVKPAAGIATKTIPEEESTLWKDLSEGGDSLWTGVSGLFDDTATIPAK